MLLNRHHQRDRSPDDGSYRVQTIARTTGRTPSGRSVQDEEAAHNLRVHNQYRKAAYDLMLSECKRFASLSPRMLPPAEMCTKLACLRDAMEVDLEENPAAVPDGDGELLATEAALALDP